MTGVVWIAGAERLAVSSPGGDITSTAPARVVWHTTEATSGEAAQWQNMQRVLTSKAAEPQVLYDPVTDRLGQFMPLDVSGRALKNDGSTRSNRVGRVCIQVEVIAYAAKPFTDYWRPGPHFKALMAAIRSWGIPDVCPAGPFPRFVNGVGNLPASPRDRTTWATKGGHYSHAQIPGNSHGDPGGISLTELFAAAAPAAPTPTPAPAKEDGFNVSEADRVIAYLKQQQALTGVEGARYAQEINENRGQTKILKAAIDANTKAINELAALVKAKLP